MSFPALRVCYGEGLNPSTGSPFEYRLVAFFATGEANKTYVCYDLKQQQTNFVHVYFFIPLDHL